jgi:putative ABC transport system ATP-binding protein
LSTLAINLENMHYRYKDTPANYAGLSIEQWKVGITERVFLYGNSGSGKTTLLNLLCGILIPTSGSVNLFGNNISTLSNSQRDLFRAKNIGVVSQKFNLIPYLSVLKNIQLAVYFAKNSRPEMNNDVKTLLNVLQLPNNIIHRQVNQLSVGQQQRVAIARALINYPKLLLVDEPTSALDASAKNAFMDLLMQICNNTKMTLIFVSHDTALSHHFDSSLDITTLSRTLCKTEESIA